MFRFAQHDKNPFGTFVIPSAYCFMSFPAAITLYVITSLSRNLNRYIVENQFIEIGLLGEIARKKPHRAVFRIIEYMRF